MFYNKTNNYISNVNISRVLEFTMSYVEEKEYRWKERV